MGNPITPVNFCLSCVTRARARSARPRRAAFAASLPPDYDRAAAYHLLFGFPRFVADSSGHAFLLRQGNDTGLPMRLSTSTIAEKFIEYYWRQSVPYVSASSPAATGVILHQSTGRQAAVINRLGAVRQEPEHSLTVLQRQPRKWRSLMSMVERVVIRMPLWKLQTVGRHSLEFLYGPTDNRHEIELKPGVAYCLREFHGLIGDLVRGSWLRYVRKINGSVLGEAVDLHEFMFGSERTALSAVQPLLRDLQTGRCFYRHGGMTPNASHVDHFIPWSRYPVDLGHNFVLAHASCNSSKGDRLAAEEHLGLWVERNQAYGDQIGSELKGREIASDLGTANWIARWAYSQAWQSRGLTWLRGQTMVPLTDAWERMLGQPAIATQPVN